MGKRCQVCDGPIVNGRCKYCGMPYRNDMELYHLNEDRSEHYRHASAKVKKAMAENEIPLSDRNKTVPKAAKTSSARTQTIRTQNTKVQTSRIQTSGTKKTSGQSYSAQTARTYSTGKKTAKSEKEKSVFITIQPFVDAMTRYTSHDSEYKADYSIHILTSFPYRWEAVTVLP